MLNSKIKDYHIQSELGHGGMATVFLAHDDKFDTNVAIKVLNKEFVHNDNIRKRFISEARSMFKMSHPSIIKVSDLIDQDGTVAFVMEFIEGETLKDYMERKGKLSDEEIKNLFSQMLEAVGYVHKQQLVHRDIKPSNFMINPDGQIKLMDFGIAKTTDTSSAEYTQTGTGVQMGTPMYMSPEQVKSSKEVSYATDIYSLGVVLWQMVMGRKPYNSNTLSTVEIHIKILQESLEHTGKDWDKVIFKALEKEPTSRFSNAISFKNALKDIEEIANDKTILENPFPHNQIPEPRFSSQTKNLLVDNATQKTASKKYLKAGLVFLFTAVLVGVFYLSNMGGSKDVGTTLVVDSAKTEDSPVEKKYLVGCIKNTNGEYKYGFIDASGNWLIQPNFTYVGDFNGGLAMATIMGKDGILKYGFIDTKGNWLIQPNFNTVGDFDGGLAMATIIGKDGFSKYGFLDAKGNWVIQPNFEYASYFHEGLAGVEFNRNWGFIDTQGNWVIPPNFDYVGDFHEGLASAELNGKHGFIDTQGNWVIPANFDYVCGFHEGLAMASINGKHGFIDTQGNWVIPPNVETVGEFHEGLAMAAINGKYGFIDAKGNWVIQPIFETVGDFHEGLAKAIFNGKYGFIDTKGNWVIQPKYDYDPLLDAHC